MSNQKILKCITYSIDLSFYLCLPFFLKCLSCRTQTAVGEYSSCPTSSEFTLYIWGVSFFSGICLLKHSRKKAHYNHTIDD